MAVWRRPVTPPLAVSGGFNRIVMPNSIDTSTLMSASGYLLEPVSSRGPRDSAPRQAGRTTSDAVTLFLDKTIVTSQGSTG